MSKVISVRWATAFGLLTLGLVAATSCVRFEPDVVLPSAFQIAGGHAQLSCEACHGAPPFSALPMDCNSCHEADRKEPAPGHHAPQTCDGANCHSAEDLTWGDIGVNHDFLPLVGSHAIDCTACHADVVNYTDLLGQSDYCWNCHEDDRDPGGHYADAVDPLNPFLRWDCGPCHTSTAWNDQPFFHEPRTPHGAVTFGPPVGTDTGLEACVVTPEPGWVAACIDCHPAAPADTTTYVCFSCHPNVHDLVYPENTCLTCHASAQAQSEVLYPPDDVCTSLP